MQDKNVENFITDLPPSYKHLISMAENSTIPYIKEMHRKLYKFGFLTNKQLEAMDYIIKNEEQRKLNATGVAPTGYLAVSGTIVSFKTSFDKFFDRYTTKMLVNLETGVTVFGPKPFNCPLKLGKIKFEADFRPSKNDKLYGFFSRPIVQSFQNLNGE